MDGLWIWITDLFAGLDNGLGDFFGNSVRVLVMLVGLVIYLVPTVLAFQKQSPNKKLVILINVFAGWTVVGWVVALFFALTKKRIGK
jgi:hypothetical protein